VDKKYSLLRVLVRRAPHGTAREVKKWITVNEGVIVKRRDVAVVLEVLGEVAYGTTKDD